MTTYNELIAYFQGLRDIVPAIEFVVVGDDEAIIEQQNTRVKYPALWVETPSVRFVDAGGVPAKRFRFALVVFTSEPKKTTEEANSKLSLMLSIMEQLYARIYTDAETCEEFVLVLNDADNEPVRRWSADNCYGWRMEIDIELERCECPE